MIKRLIVLIGHSSELNGAGGRAFLLGCVGICLSPYGMAVLFFP